MASKFGMDGNSGGSPEKIDGILRKALKLKEEGNSLFAAKELRKAIRKYHEALLHLRGVTHGDGSALKLIGFKGKDERLPESQQFMYEKLMVDCHNNLAACLLQNKSESFDKIVEHCDHVISLQPRNSKAHSRRGQALYHLKDYDGASEALLNARKYCDPPVDPQITKYMTLCQRGQISQNSQLKATYKKMFQPSPGEPGAN